MKEQVILILFTILIFISCNRNNEKATAYYENGQAKWVIKYNSNSDTTDKSIIGYYEDGTKKCIKNLLNGLENGEQIVYFPNGQIEYVCNKINGVQFGISKTLFENGKLYAQGNFENGLRQGNWVLRNKDGTKFLRNYINDTLYSSTKEIRPDSSVVFGQYDKGIEVGRWTTKTSDSIITMISTYENGVRHGSVKTFYQTGEIYVNGYFNKGMKHGEWEIHNKLGGIDTIEVYRNDSLIEYKLIK